MKKMLSLVFAIFFIGSMSAQNVFEGVFTIEYRQSKDKISKTEIRVKNHLIHLKNIQGGVAKYDYYVLNLTTREFYTVSKAGKKVAIKYNIDKLMELYETAELKAGYKRNTGLEFKATDKVKEENGNKLTKYVAEDDFLKSSFWLTDVGFNFNQLIPVLRLIGCWNESQWSNGIIINAEVNNKISKRETTISVTAKKEVVAKEIFEMPKNYLQKDFAKLMEEEKNNKDLKSIVQTFAGF